MKHLLIAAAMLVLGGCITVGHADEQWDRAEIRYTTIPLQHNRKWSQDDLTEDQGPYSVIYSSFPAQFESALFLAGAYEAVDIRYYGITRESCVDAIGTCLEYMKDRAFDLNRAHRLRRLEEKSAIDKINHAVIWKPRSITNKEACGAADCGKEP